MQLSACKDIDGESGIQPLEVEDIKFLEWSSSIDRIIVHTTHGKYYGTGPLKFWVNGLIGSGHKFLLVDRHNAVNANNVEAVDTATFKKICFKEGGTCSMTSTKKYRVILEDLLKLNPNIIVGLSTKKNWSTT